MYRFPVNPERTAARNAESENIASYGAHVVGFILLAVSPSPQREYARKQEHLPRLSGGAVRTVEGATMQYRMMGSTGIEVSALGMGTMRLPLEDGAQGYTSSRGADVEKSVELIRHALDAGITYFDTAFNYLHGESEKIVGHALQDGYRKRAVIATKSPIWMIKEPDDFDTLLHKQLKRLQTDHVDVYLLHCITEKDWRRRVVPHHVLDSLLAAKEAGLVRAIGFSFHDSIDLFREVLDFADWDVCQLQLNYLDRAFQGGLEAARLAADKGVAVSVMEPLRGGHLVNVPDDVRETFHHANPDRSAVEWAFDFLWDMPEVTTVLSGMGTIKEVDTNSAYADRARIGMLSPAEHEVFNAVERQFAAKPTIACTGCNYCAGCPQHVTIPYNLQTYNQYVLSGNLERAKWEYATTIPLNGATAAACTGCGACEERCPQKTAISSWMPKIDALFG